MTTITQDAKQIAESIVVLQCKIECRQLNPLSAILYALSRYGTRAPAKIEAEGVKEILSYREKADIDLLFAPEIQVKAFAEKHHEQLETILRQRERFSASSAR